MRLYLVCYFGDCGIGVGFDEVGMVRVVIRVC